MPLWKWIGLRHIIGDSQWPKRQKQGSVRTWLRFSLLASKLTSAASAPAAELWSEAGSRWSSAGGWRPSDLSLRASSKASNDPIPNSPAKSGSSLQLFQENQLQTSPRYFYTHLTHQRAIHPGHQFISGHTHTHLLCVFQTNFKFHLLTPKSNNHHNKSTWN